MFSAFRRRTARAAGYLQRGIRRDGYAQDTGRALYDALQRFRVIVLQVHIDAKAGTERSRQQTTSCGGTHQRKRVQVYLDATR